MLGDPEVHENPLDDGELSTDCLAPGALSVEDNKLSGKGGKGNLVGGECDDTSGNEYIAPRV